MKKVILTVLFVFAISSQINANSLETSIKFVDCGSYARAAASAEMEYYDGSLWAWIDAVGFYFTVCNVVGGEDNMYDAVFL